MGKQFPATWKVNASYHTPGHEISGQTSNVSERVITIDDLLMADVFIPNIDEAMNHYDYRSIYSDEAGKALAREYDKNVAQVGVLAARASATVTGGNGGTQLTASDSVKNDGPTIVSKMADAAQEMDEKDVPETDRMFVLRPAQYRLLTQTTNVLDRDIGGQGSIATGEVPMVEGFEIVKSNHLPSTNITSGPSAYQGDFSTTYGLAWHRSAMGTVQLVDLAVEMEYQVNRQGTLMVAKYAVGHGILRPESAVEMQSST